MKSTVNSDTNNIVYESTESSCDQHPKINDHDLAHEP